MTEPIREVKFFEVPKRPTGGTVYMAYLPPRFPTGGGTVYVDPRKSGNPYARIDEDPGSSRPVVDVQLSPPSDGLVLEGFAGPGGWSEGLRLAGFTNAVGYELDPDACGTAIAAGHRRVEADVSGLRLEHMAGKVDGAVLSPPCPPWSQSGRRLGPLDKTAALRRIDSFAAASKPDLVEWSDPRSPLCAEPMRWAVALEPRWIALEQVPGALPLWRHIAGHLETMGYSVATGVLRCEEYGVPQTRKRAVLVARRDGIAALPSPTHLRYGAPAGLLPRWRSMHEAIGWGLTDRPAWTVTAGGTATGGAEFFGNAKCRARLDGRRLTHEEAAALQGFRLGYPFTGRTKGSVARQIGDAVPPPLATAVLKQFVTASVLSAA